MARVSPDWLPGTVFYDINGVNDELFEKLLVRMTAIIANRQFCTDFFNADNVYDYIDFKDNCRANLHRQNLLLVKAF